VPSHFVAHWHHDASDDPIRIYEEVTDDPFELRKVEEFRYGRLLRADSITDAVTSLSWEPIPELAEIASQPEFSVEEITPEAFETVWKRAKDVAS
jgi:hypothetical protein